MDDDAKFPDLSDLGKLDLGLVQLGAANVRKQHLPLLATGLAVTLVLRLCVMMDTRARLRSALQNSQKIPGKIDEVLKSPAAKELEAGAGDMMAATEKMRAKLRTMIASLDANVLRLTGDAETLASALAAVSRPPAEIPNAPNAPAMAVALLNATIDAARADAIENDDPCFISDDVRELLSRTANSARETCNLFATLKQRARRETVSTTPQFGRRCSDTLLPRVGVARMLSAISHGGSAPSRLPGTDLDKTRHVENLRRMIEEMRKNVGRNRN